MPRAAQTPATKTVHDVAVASLCTAYPIVTRPFTLQSLSHRRRTMVA
jgi:hypothetical protein